MTVGTELLGGRTWTTDIRITNSAVNNIEPQAYGRADQSVDFLWKKTTGGNGSYYYGRTGLTGTTEQAETYITDRVMAPFGAEFPLGPAGGIDSQGNIHVTFGVNADTIGYEKFDNNGNVLVPAKSVGPIDGWLSEMPSLAVGTDDTIHIANGDCRFQCEDIVYDKLANDGSEVWTNRVVSSDIGSVSSFALIKAERFSGSVLFTFGSLKGSWLGRADKYGVKDLPSIKYRTTNDVKVADVDATPDGSMHLVWEDGGNLYYTLVNASGSKLADAVQVVSGATVGPFPRIAAASDNRVAIVWQDNRTGSSQLMYSIFKSGDNPAFATQVRLTNSTGDAVDPTLFFDPYDDLVVAWSDSRDGNREIYLKRTLHCSVELFGEPVTLAGMSFLHPNETKLTPLTVRNKGGLIDNFTVSLRYSAGADAAGWVISLNRTDLRALAPDGLADVGLSLHAPATARSGDNISLTVNASGSDPSCFDEIQLSAFVQVTRSLKLTGYTGTKPGEAGDTIAFGLVVTNMGDVREDDIRLEHILGTGSPDWNVSFDKSTAALDSKASTNFTVFAAIPANAQCLGDISFGIVAYPANMPNGGDSLQLTIACRPSLNLSVSADPVLQLADPGAVARFAITVASQGNVATSLEMRVQGSAGPLPSFFAPFDREVFTLGPASSSLVVFSAPVPFNATAGTRVTFHITALSRQYGTNASVNVTVGVSTICGVHLLLPSSAQALQGPVTTIELYATNTGNSPQSVLPTVAYTPPGWGARLTFDGASPLPIAVAGRASFSLEVAPSSEPTAGPYGIGIQLASGDCGTVASTLQVTVPSRPGIEVRALNDVAGAPPGGEVSFDVVIRNAGNVITAYSVLAATSPETFPLSLAVLADDGVTELPLQGAIVLAGGQQAVLRVRVGIPRDTTSDLARVTLRVHATPSLNSSLVLTAVVQRPDLLALGLVSDPPRPSAGDATRLSFDLSNVGNARSRGGVVYVSFDGAPSADLGFSSLGPGEAVRFTVDWVASEGLHELRFEAVEDSSGTELKTDNNALVAYVHVGGSGSGAGASGAPIETAAGTLVFAAGLLAFAVVMVRERRRKASSLEAKNTAFGPVAPTAERAMPKGPAPPPSPGVPPPTAPGPPRAHGPLRRIRK